LKTSRKENAFLALQKAIQLRSSLGYKLWDAIPVYECASRLGMEVRFIDVPSLEAIYVKRSPPTIIISSLRPAGRQAFSCAHEIAHHVFDHGSRLDKEMTFPNSKLDPEEFLAQTFAGYLLMPKAAVEGAFVKHGMRLQACTPIEVYTISNWFGVGYDTLINHMQYGLRIISADRAEELQKTRPQQIREALVGKDFATNLIIAGPHWTTRTIDIQVGDIVLLPKGVANEGSNVKFIQSYRTGDLFEGTMPGVSQFQDCSNGWSAPVRVSKRGFVGRNVFRYLEDEEYDQGEPPNNQ